MTDLNQILDDARDLGEAEFRELADNAPVMIWRSRLDQQCDWFNKPRQLYAGKTQEQLLGFGWTDDLHPDDLGPCIQCLQQAFAARETFSMPYRLRRHDGAYRWFLDNGAPFYRDGEFAGYVGSCTDITEHKELEAHQEVLLAELNHRVKNNLQLIIAFLQLSRIRAQGSEAKELLEAAITRIQGVGAVQAELHRSPTGHVDLAQYLPNLVRASLQAESGNRTQLTVDVESVRVPFKLANDLGLIVNELITNAVKHGGGENGRIHLGLRQLAQRSVQVSVQDAGPGFAPQHLSDALPSGARMRGQGLIESLAKRCHAVLTRVNDGGARVTVTLALP